MLPESPPHSRLRAIGVYGLALALCMLALTVVMQLWRADLRVPLRYNGDALMMQAWIKALIEQDWYLDNPAVGAPEGLDSRGFPMADNLHFAVFKAIALFFPHWAVTFNLAFLLTFPLTTVTALFVLRRFGVAAAPAILASLLFAFLPYHFLRIEHLFLASYHLIPLATFLIVRVWRGESLCGVRGIVPLLLCALLASAGIYYATFTCFFLLVAGLAGWRREGRKAVLGSAAVLIALIGVGVVVNLLPSLVQFGRDPALFAGVRRHPQEAEMLGIKMTNLLFPVTYHRLPLLAWFKGYYQRSPLLTVTEGDTATLGVIASVGFLYLLLRLFTRRSDAPRNGLMDGLSLFNLAAFLLGTMGGLGAVLSYGGFFMIRGYNRLSVFIAFFALAAVALLVTNWWQRQSSSPARRTLAWVFVAALLFIGLFDQTSESFIPAYADIATAHAADAQFVAAVEGRLPPRAMVYQLPYLAFPEHAPLGGLREYDPLRAYLHSKRLRWSYGALRGRVNDRRLAGLALQPIDNQIANVERLGFHGLWVERSAYSDGAVHLEMELARLLGPATLVSSDGKRSFFILHPESRGASPYQDAAKARAAALSPISVAWDKKLRDAEERFADRCRRRSTGTATFTLRNDLPYERHCILQAAFSTNDAANARLLAASGLMSREITLKAEPSVLRQQISVPPGIHTVTLTCETIGSFGVPASFALEDLSLAEAP
jgi:phosphoglycerol transferase